MKSINLIDSHHVSTRSLAHVTSWCFPSFCFAASVWPHIFHLSQPSRLAELSHLLMFCLLDLEVSPHLQWSNFHRPICILQAIGISTPVGYEQKHAQVLLQRVPVLAPGGPFATSDKWIAATPAVHSQFHPAPSWRRSHVFARTHRTVAQLALQCSHALYAICTSLSVVVSLLVSANVPKHLGEDHRKSF